MQTMLKRAGRFARSDAPVAVLGETGSGKEVVARALHASSKRGEAPFVAVNVAALPAELLESELFGHVKGAFTGAAVTKRGLLEAANGGTLLLDEIADMPLALQAKLLRALQDGEVRRVGDTRAFSVDVRILCATNQDLRAAVDRRRFREDLFYRLAVFELTLPPLRERAEDVLPLAGMFLQHHRHRTGRFTPRAQHLLKSYRWPGNVRELANAVNHGAVLSGGADVDAEHLPEQLSRPALPPPSTGSLRTLAEVERDHVVRVLEACGGHHTDAARVLGIGRTTLWRKLRAYGIDVEV